MIVIIRPAACNSDRGREGERKKERKKVASGGTINHYRNVFAQLLYCLTQCHSMSNVHREETFFSRSTKKREKESEAQKM